MKEFNWRFHVLLFQWKQKNAGEDIVWKYWCMK